MDGKELCWLIAVIVIAVLCFAVYKKINPKMAIFYGIYELIIILLLFLYYITV